MVNQQLCKTQTILLYSLDLWPVISCLSRKDDARMGLPTLSAKENFPESCLNRQIKFVAKARACQLTDDFCKRIELTVEQMEKFKKWIALTIKQIGKISNGFVQHWNGFILALTSLANP